MRFSRQGYSGSQTCLLIQLAKCAELGKVKTRMQPQLTQPQSLHLHQVMLEHNLQNLSQNLQYDYQLALAGEMTVDFARQIESWKAEYSIVISEQQGEDLGQRMYHAIAQGLQQGYTHICLIGSDCPSISADLIAEIFACLKQADKQDVIITPAYDGGYVLIAMNAAHRSLFADINWGSEQVLQQTKSVAEQSGLAVYCTQPLPDIDDYADLAYLPPALQAAYW